MVEAWLKNHNPEWKQYYDPYTDDVVIALILAIQFNDWNSIQDLIHLQKDVNARDSSDIYWTPLMYAAYEGEFETVKLIVEAGADVNLRGSEPDDFALNLAAYAGNREVFEYLAPLTSPDLRAIAEKTLSKRAQ